MKFISISAFQQALESEKTNPEVAFINVCSPEEYSMKHINGVKSLPLDELESRMGELKDKITIYVHCQSGNRSRRAIEMLERLGVEANLVQVEGGLIAWEQAGLHTESTISV